MAPWLFIGKHASGGYAWGKSANIAFMRLMQITTKDRIRCRDGRILWTR